MNKKNYRLLIFPAIALLIAAVFALTQRPADQHVRVIPDGRGSGCFSMHFETMGTDAHLVVYASTQEEAGHYLNSARNTVQNIAFLMSFYNPQSDITALNEAGAGENVEVSEKTYQVVSSAKQFFELTHGAFDITYTPLKEIWRQAQKNDRLPSDSALQDVLARIGSGKIELLENNRVRLKREGMSLDLGGIAKGFAIDQAIEEMKKLGCRSALVDIGGDMVVLGRKENGEKWRVQVRDPFGKFNGPVMLSVEDTAVATSGDYARYYTIADKRFSHIIDPRSGRPVKNVPSVTIIAPTALEADALATAVSVMGARRGMELIDSLEGVESMIMERTDDGEIITYSSDEFSEYEISEQVD